MGSRCRRSLLLAAAVLAAGLLCGAGPAGAADPPAELGARVERALSGPALSKAEVGLQVMDLRTGEVLYRRNASRPFIAASNAKLVTAAAALEALGPDYEFTTAVHADGPVEGGVLRGNLVVRGGGDPTIGGRYDGENAGQVLRRWAHVLHVKGLRSVAGDVVADDTFFDGIRRHPRWADYPAWKWHYTGTSALSVNDNCVRVLVRPGAAAGGPALVSVSPASAPVKVANRCKTASKRHAIWFDRAADGDTITVGGFIRRTSSGYSHDVAIADPALHAAAAFKEALEAEAIAVAGRARVTQKGRRAPAAGGEPLVVRRTALAPVLRTMLQRSHNHYAEQVLKTIGAEASGVGSWDSGAARAEGVLREMGFTDDQFHVDDGSGLSRQDKLTPELTATLLFRMARSEHGPTFTSLLPVAGKDGTLSGRLAEPPYGGNVRAKTGYLSGVGALSGYARTRSGREVAFSILVNDSRNPPGAYSMRTVVDGLCRAIVDSL